MNLPNLLDGLQASARTALDCGEVTKAEQLIDEALSADSSIVHSDEWAQLRDVDAWPDAWLVAAIRGDPPDLPALEALANRYWKYLFGRCYLLALNHEKAKDLAQEAWSRVLRARRRLKPDGNFPGYLVTIAMNVWRDSQRLARRAGPLAENQLESLEVPLTTHEGETIVLGSVLPDLKALRTEETTRLRIDIDQALEYLTPRMREVLLARFIAGESCAEIGRRYGRTEQTISAWIREAIAQMRTRLEEPEPQFGP